MGHSPEKLEATFRRIMRLGTITHFLLLVTVALTYFILGFTWNAQGAACSG